MPDRHPADVVTVTLPRAHRALAAEGRILLIDAPPLHGVAETPFVLSVAHHVILVVDASSEFFSRPHPIADAAPVLVGIML